MIQPKQELWTIEDVANCCRVKPSVVRYWIHNARLPHIKLGRHVRFDPEDVKQWLELHKQGKRPGTDDDLRLIT